MEPFILLAVIIAMTVINVKATKIIGRRSTGFPSARIILPYLAIIAVPFLLLLTFLLVGLMWDADRHPIRFMVAEFLVYMSATVMTLGTLQSVGLISLVAIRRQNCRK